MAHWLLLQKNTVGVSNTPAKFSASWKSPSEVPPSPKYVRNARRSPFNCEAHAAPTACSVCVAMGTAGGNTLTSGGAALPRSVPIQ
jgi:hypothetical protein